MKDDRILALVLKQRTLLGRLAGICAEAPDADGPSLLTLHRAVGTLFEMEAVMIKALGGCGWAGAEGLRLEFDSHVAESKRHSQDLGALLVWTSNRALPFCAVVTGGCERVLKEEKLGAC